MRDQPQRTFLGKVVIAGDESVGKTTLARALSGNPVSSEYEPTVGLNIFRTNFTCIEGQFHLQFWDITGNIRFRNVMSSMYKGAHVLIYVFDRGNRASFDSLPYWLNYMQFKQDGWTLHIVLGNCTERDPVVSTEEGCQLSRDLSVVYIEKSVVTCTIDDLVLKVIARHMAQVRSGYRFQ